MEYTHVGFNSTLYYSSCDTALEFRRQWHIPAHYVGLYLKLILSFYEALHPILLLGRERNREESSAGEIVLAFRFLKLQESKQSDNPFISDLPTPQRSKMLFIL